MKKIKLLGFVAVLIGTLLFSNPVDARKNAGNYVDGNCLVVWESTTFLGITWSYSETRFCY